MNLTGAVVLFAVIWFLVFLVMLQIGARSQADAGEVVPGTPESAPAQDLVRRKALWTTAITAVLWAGLAAVILWGGISIEDIDWTGRLK